MHKKYQIEIEYGNLAIIIQSINRYWVDHFTCYLFLTNVFSFVVTKQKCKRMENLSEIVFPSQIHFFRTMHSIHVSTDTNRSIFRK